MLSKQPDTWIYCEFTVECQNVERKKMFWCKRMTNCPFRLILKGQGFLGIRGSPLKIIQFGFLCSENISQVEVPCVWVGILPWNLLWKPRALRKGILYWEKSECLNCSKTTPVNANELILSHVLGRSYKVTGRQCSEWGKSSYQIYIWTLRFVQWPFV